VVCPTIALSTVTICRPFPEGKIGSLITTLSQAKIRDVG